VCVKDRAGAVPFYRDKLGLRLKTQDPYAAVFDIGGVDLRLSSVEDWRPHAHTVLGFAVKDARAAASEMKARGVKFNIYPGFNQDADGVWTSPDGRARVAWFNDPEGNNLSITEIL
jgi:catechol 2,3-dioxygenase-like lactoylglutathione lyase family enzyme